jgi:hypothetical protein
MAIKQYHHSDK